MAKKVSDKPSRNKATPAAKVTAKRKAKGTNAATPRKARATSMPKSTTPRRRAVAPPAAAPADVEGAAMAMAGPAPEVPAMAMPAAAVPRAATANARKCTGFRLEIWRNFKDPLWKDTEIILRATDETGAVFDLPPPPIYTSSLPVLVALLQRIAAANADVGWIFEGNAGLITGPTDSSAGG
jgi:hypothetical protein